MARRFLTILAILQAAAIAAGADEPEAPAPEFAVSFVQEDLKAEVGVVAGSGRIHIRQGDFELSIDDGGVVLWVDSEKFREFRKRARGTREDDAPSRVEDLLGPVIRELYAEGGVTLRRDAVEIRAERLFFNFAKNRAVILHAEVLSRPGDAASLPLRMRADQIYQVAKGELRTDAAKLTTCLYGEPHYELTVSNVRVRQEDDGSVSFRSTGNVLRAGDVPVLWVPFAYGSTDVGMGPLENFYFGRSSQFGPYGGVRVGAGIRVGEGEEEKRIGNWSLDGFYRSRRGPGLSGDLDYDWSGARGRLRAEYQRDTLDDDHISGLPIARENRGRVRWQHRHRLDDDFLGGRLEGLSEISWISDRGYLPEYRRDEDLSDKEQETFARLGWTRAEHALALTGRWQANEFQSQTEYRPELAYDLTNLTIAEDFLGLGNLGLSGEAEGASLYRHFDHRLAERGVFTERTSARAALHLPFSVGIVKLSPQVGGGAGSWSGHQDETRTELSAGVGAATDLWRRFPDASSELLQVDGLRHEIRVLAGYRDRFHVTLPSRRLVAQDPEDQVDEFRAFDLAVRNRLETMRDGRQATLLDLEVRGVFFPDRTDDRLVPFGAREEYRAGLPALLLPEEERWRTIRRRGMGPLTARLAANPRTGLGLDGDAWYDFETGRFETWSAGASYRVDRDLSVSLGYRTIQGDSSVATGEADFRLSSRWEARVYQQVDFREDGALLSGITLRRRYHDFAFEVGFKHDVYLRETSFTVTLIPTFGSGEAPRAAESDDGR